MSVFNSLQAQLSRFGANSSKARNRGIRRSEGRIRILHVTEAPKGGVLIYLANLIQRQVLSPSIEAVHVVGPSVNEPALRRCLSSKLSFNSVPYQERSWLILLRLGLMTLHALHEIRPDIVHVHSSFAGIAVRLFLLPIRGRPKLIYTPHAWSFSPGATKHVLLRKMCERVLAIWTDCIIAVSEHEMRLALDAGISPRRCTVVLTGVPEIVSGSGTTAAAEPASRQGCKRRVLFVGRFDYQKGFDIYLDVMRRLGNMAEGIVAGSPMVGRRMDLVAPPNVRILGWCSPEEVSALYHEADLILMPSRFEGLPLVALEAMRAGLPVFASDVGPMCEIVQDGVSGRLFPGASPERIASAIASATDAELRRLGEAGRGIFQERFTAERMERDMLDAYQTVLGEVDASGSSSSRVLGRVWNCRM
jgi:glycosyltransferase involved in cell wall biosynthesis